jgi:exodeoxyribonuclease VII large subunit
MPKEGDQVIASGEISVYVPRGQYQLVIRELQFLGVGALLLKLQQLKEQLQARGWFDAARKKPLPKFPKRIGVVTSPTGAVIQDILHVLTRRFSGFHVILNPVKVQGEGAAQEIAQAIADFNKYQLVDVLIVGRGGGSIEDLWAFNEEIVAKAIFESQIPVIAAVGHETDVTIADFVADVRAPTPSAAAEIAISEKANLLKFLSQTGQLLWQRVSQQVRQGRERLSTLRKHPVFSSPYALLAQPIQELDRIRSDLDEAAMRKLEQGRLRLHSGQQRMALLSPLAQIGQMKGRLLPYPDRLISSMGQALRAKRESLKGLSGHLHSLNPQNLLRKGYAVLFADKNRSVILSAKELAPNQKFIALLHDGQVAATANLVEHHDAKSSLL